MPPHPADTAATLLAAAVRAPFALFWGPGCIIRRTLHGFVWGADERQHCAPPPAQVWRVTCEPPCYGCDRCGCRHG